MNSANRSRAVSLVPFTLAIATIFWLLPLLAVAISAFSDPIVLQQSPSNLALFKFSTANFSNLAAVGFDQWLWNSSVVATASTITALSISIPLGYAAGILRLQIARTTVRLLLVAYVVPSSFLVFSIVTVASVMGVVGSPLFVGAAAGALISPICAWLMERQFLLVPRQLYELALLDGFTNWSIITRVLFRAIAPSFVVVAAFAFVSGWGDYTLSLSLLPNDAAKTIPLGIAQFVTGDIWQWGNIFAAITLASAPPIIVGLIALSSGVLFGKRAPN